MQKTTSISLFKDTFFYSLTKWGSRLSAFAVTPIAISYLSKSEYGYLSLVRTVSAFFATLGLLAIVDQGLPRFFIDTEIESEKKEYASTSAFISGVGTVAVIALILLSTPFITLYFKDIEVPFFFTGIIAIICIVKNYQYVGNYLLRWTFQSSLFTKIILAETFVAAIVTILGIIFFNWRAKGILIAGSFFTLVAGSWAIFSVKSYIEFDSFSKSKMKELLKYSWPFIGLNVFAFFTRSLDRIFLSSIASLEATGVFSAASAIANFHTTAISGFYVAWGPYTLKNYREEWAPKRFSQYFSIISCSGIVSIVGLGLWGSPLISIIKPQGDYREIGVFIPWIISGTLIYQLGGYFTPGPAIEKKTYWKFISFIIAGSINALLNYLLIKRMGILGAGIATTISSLIAGIFNQVVSDRFFFVPNRWKTSFTLILLFTTIVSTLQLENFKYNINNLSLVYRALLTIFLIMVAVAPFFREINESKILHKIFSNIFKKLKILK